jgi:hypothetical protein
MGKDVPTWIRGKLRGNTCRHKPHLGCIANRA